MTELTENAKLILQSRYLQENETPDDMFWRVAQAVAKAEKGSSVAWTETFHKLLSSLKFLPNSPTLVNAGTEQGCLSACFCISPEDTMESIQDNMKDAILIEKWGGGIGFGFSKIRPKGSSISTVHGYALGPVQVMRNLSYVTASVSQGSFRLGAHMGQLHISHPDILEFIHCKDNINEQTEPILKNFNISVQIHDKFMEAVELDQNINLVFQDKNYTGISGIHARTLWNKICESAWRTGDPGVVFMDRVLESQPNPQMGDIQTSNPCGEEFLEDYGNCCLGSINLSLHLLRNDQDNESKRYIIDYNELGKTIRTAVRFLDNVIEINQFPLEKLREVNLATRRIGLGVMGWADLLSMLKIPYDSGKAIELAKEVSKFLTHTAWNESTKLAEERGTYPEYSRKRMLELHNIGDPVRHSSVTTEAPTGTISQIAGCSSGIEPHYALVSKRKILWKDHDSDATEILEIPYSVKKTLYGYTEMDEVPGYNLVEGIKGVFQDNNLLQYFPTALDIDPEWHIRMQAAWQKNITNSISKTINMPKSVTVEDVKKAYMLAWKEKCKAVTIYRDQSRKVQVLNSHETLADAIKDNKDKSPIVWLVSETEESIGNKKSIQPTDKTRERPESLDGTTTRIRTAQGNMYITVNSFDDKPFEVFVTLGKPGSQDNAYCDGMARLISLHLRSGIPIEKINKQLRHITSEAVWENGKLIGSPVDALALVMSKYEPKKNIYASTLAKSIVEHTYGHLEKRSAAVIGQICPDCSSNDIRSEEGCFICNKCGWTKCG